MRRYQASKEGGLAGPLAETLTLLPRFQRFAIKHVFRCVGVARGRGVQGHAAVQGAVHSGCTCPSATAQHLLTII